MKRFYFISLLALLILVFVVGFLTYMKLSDKTEEKTPKEEINATAKSSLVLTSIPWLDSLTEGEKKILTSQPSANASESEKNAYGKLVGNEAKKVELVNIGEFCKPSPLVLYSSGLAVKFKNNDTKAHQLIFGAEDIYSINPGETKSIPFSEDRRGGVISYSCQSVGRVGFIVFPK